MKAKRRIESSLNSVTMLDGTGGHVRSAIEASKIAGHATVSQTGDYTIVQLKRQEELTRAIQNRVAKARNSKRDEGGQEESTAASAAA